MVPLSIGQFQEVTGERAAQLARSLRTQAERHEARAARTAQRDARRYLTLLSGVRPRLGGLLISLGAAVGGCEALEQYARGRVASPAR